MDSEITSLTQTAGSTLVTLMASDAWRTARDLVVRWWRGAQPGRAGTVAAELDASRGDLAAGQAQGEGDPGEAGPDGEAPAEGVPDGEAPGGQVPGDGAARRGAATPDPAAEAELRAQWQGMFRRALAADPSAAGGLRQLLAELEALAATAPAARAEPSVVQHATASGSARVYQAGHDQHVTER